MMIEPKRVPPEEVFQNLKAGKALLVCAYEDDAKFKRMQLENWKGASPSMNSNPDFPPYQKIRKLSSIAPEPKRPALPVRQPNTSEWDIRMPRLSWAVLRRGKRRVIPSSKRNKTQMSLRGRIDRGSLTLFCYFQLKEKLIIHSVRL
jgi:hypothetical protein